MTIEAGSTVQDAPPCCPDCGGALSVERDVLIEEPYLAGRLLRHAELPRRQRVAYAAAFCSGCEFCVEIERPSCQK